ncbi:SusF/SusE family outer membrane protein [Maribellus sp. CM-23]|uniref:SusE domain-containing protein n=1 Tax=Maribellus sp. CM-23 TaxID=2781026 RepID=UPI001F1A656C|nr:SusF/SusE family outer membrane protein [Maribellus sp. CM-23]MCE4563473.1 SusF/SusE family outer membrane protein [Maribellus sp. CM-23]
MKRINIRTILFAMSLLVMGSCGDEDDVKIILDTVDDGMLITANVEEIILSQDLMDETALTFHWNPAQERNNNGSITYYFKLGLPGLTTAIDKIEIEEGVSEYSINHFDLNSMLYGLGVNLGSTTQIEAEVIAWSEGDYFVKPEISKTKVIVTTFEIAPVNLYLVGSANPKGPEISDGIKLTEIIEGRNIGNNYEWVGTLQEGTFKFVNSITEDKGSWSKGDNETSLVKQETIGTSDLEFTVTKAGLYSIILDKKKTEIIHGYKGFSHVWGVGLGIGIAWSMPSSTEFNWDPNNPGIFTLECTTQANQDFKLPYNDQSSGWSCPFLRPVNANANIWEDDKLQATPSGYNPDLKWLITEEQAGECILTIDAFNMTISLEKKTN